MGVPSRREGVRQVTSHDNAPNAGNPRCHGTSGIVQRGSVWTISYFRAIERMNPGMCVQSDGLHISKGMR